MQSRSARLMAILFGLLTHGMFMVAVTAMIVGLFSGMESSLGGSHGRGALIWNTLLLFQFPILHSFFLSRSGQRILARLPRGRDLLTTTFALFASLQLLLVFLFWSPSHHILWQAQGSIRIVLCVLFGLSWLLLVRAMYDAGLATQLGFLGWWAVARNHAVRYPGFGREGLQRVCRQPVYVAFALTLWTGPVWTVDHFIIAIGWTAYCLIGPLFKERRYRRLFGSDYLAYQRTTPYLPSVRSLIEPHDWAFLGRSGKGRCPEKTENYGE